MDSENRNIENFFKKRLQSSEFTYQESDWKALEEKLDAAGIISSSAGSTISSVKLISVALLVATLAFISGWFLREYTQSTDSTNEYKELTSGDVEASGNINGSQETTEVGNNESSQILKDPDVPEVLDFLPPTEANQSSQPAEINRNVPAVSDKNDESAHFRTFQSPNALGYSALTNINRIESVPEILEVSTAGKGDVSESFKDQVKENKTFLSRWSVGISSGADFTSVGMLKKRTLTPKIGGQLYFQASSRVLVSAGIFYNNKKYDTNPEGYKPPQGYWENRNNGILPEDIAGECGVFDFPIRVAYRFTNQPKLNFYGAVGMSSYVITKEYYDFYYSNPNPDLADGWSTLENSRVMAGLVNLSVPVELSISPKLHFILEPYLQVPLKGMGWGAVHLNSTGSLFTIRYNPFIRK